MRRALALRARSSPASGTCRSWRADQYQVAAPANRVRTVADEAPRGRILDRNGKVLVDNRTSLRGHDRPARTLDELDGRDERRPACSRRGRASSPAPGTRPRSSGHRGQASADPQYNPLQPIPSPSTCPRTC